MHMELLLTLCNRSCASECAQLVWSTMTDTAMLGNSLIQRVEFPCEIPLNDEGEMERWRQSSTLYLPYHKLRWIYATQMLHAWLSKTRTISCCLLLVFPWYNNGIKRDTDHQPQWPTIPLSQPLFILAVNT